MRILLPPSETKRPGGGGMFAPGKLAFDDALGATRDSVRTALEALSADEEAAIRALKLGAKSRDELAHNLVLGDSGAMPAIERYTGVLYDALAVQTLDARARRWIDSHVLVQSALFGLIRAADRVPAYRLSASSRLPGLPSPHAALWRDAHHALDWRAMGWILDLRSQDYGALAPLPEGIGSYLHVVQRGADGEVRALNHFNKTAKGELVRLLAQHAPRLRTARDFVRWAGEIGLEARLDEASGELQLVSTANHQTDGRLKQ